MRSLKFKSRKEEERELGFGTAVNVSQQRVMNADGSANVERRGVAHFNPINIFHSLISMSWKKFFILVLTGYILLNSLFALVYVFVGVENLTGVESHGFVHNFWEAFFFSAQSFTTVGYGRVAPVSMTASTIAAFESMMGLLAFALATGLLYGRFSRPTAMLLYSKNCLIAPYKNITGLMFRVANARNNQLIESEASVIIAYNTEENGKVQRKFQNLELELKKINFLALSWTIVHPIDEDSPLYELTAEDLKKADAEVLILFKAIDDTYATTVYSRSSYKAEEIIMGAKFKPIIGTAPDGRFSVDLHRIDEYELVS